MLTLNTGTAPGQTLEPHEAADNAVWLDLYNPTEAERAAVERATGLVVPAQADLAEIEASSRLSRDGNVLTLSTPMPFPGGDGGQNVAPLGFVLSPEYLLTVRFAELPVFTHFAAHFPALRGEKRSADAFIGLLEGLVDRLADVLEHLGAELGAISREVFTPQPKQGRPRKVGEALQGTLRAVGNIGERLSNIRDSLLGLQRIALYVHDSAASWFPPDLRPRLMTVRQDLTSLADYDSQLSNKVQFLLDATLGFINIAQNNGINVLTVVSVVGVPPTLIAGIYGMNFKNIPEYDWAFGYQYGLALIVLSAVLPLIWFKRKGWI